VLLDYVDMVVHVQHSEEHSYYGLERLWKDGARIELPESVYSPSSSRDDLESASSAPDDEQGGTDTQDEDDDAR
jgi:ribosome-associated protein